MSQRKRGPDFRRHVFYIPGYDPFPARRYRELYRVEGEKQAEISGYELALLPSGDRGVGRWRAVSMMDGMVTESDIEVLGWSDIVQASMQGGIGATYLQLARTVWTYVASGTFRRLVWLRKGPVIAALYPIAMLLLQLGAAVLAGALVGALAAWPTWPVVGWIVALPVVWLVLTQFRKWDHKLFAYYLMHDFAFSASRNGATPEPLAKREAAFARRIAEVLASDVDEVLVVGHSSGATIAVSVLARLIREGRVADNGPDLSLLTLGQVIPMTSFLPDAKRLRGDLRLLSEDRRLVWVDVSAPGDGCSFALCDPVAVSGVAREGKMWPLVLSAAFSKTLSPITLDHLKRRYFRLHFQYLCAFDRPGDYDYFRITAGPYTLGERFEGRQPSQSRIDVPVSRYRSFAA